MGWGDERGGLTGWGGRGAQRPVHPTGIPTPPARFHPHSPVFVTGLGIGPYRNAHGVNTGELVG